MLGAKDAGVESCWLNCVHVDKLHEVLGLPENEEILLLTEQGLIDTTPLITHRYKLEDVEEAYRVFENREYGTMKLVVECLWTIP